MKCNCLLFAIKCHDLITVTFTEIDKKLTDHRVYVRLSKVIVKQQTKYSVKLQNTVLFTWKKSNLSDICHDLTFKSQSLQYLDLSSNSISALLPTCFQDTPALQHLNLHKNHISNLTAPLFQKNSKLIFLDLSSNNILRFSSVLFGNAKIGILNLSSNHFENIDGNVARFKIDQLLTDDHRICCLVKSGGTLCSTTPKWPHSCKSSFESLSARIMALLNCCLIILLNSFCLAPSFYQYRKSLKPQIIMVHGVKVATKRAESTAFLLNTVFLHLNEFFFAAYLMGLLMEHFQLNEMYYLRVETFLKSTHCKTLAFVSSFAVLNSLCILNLVSMSRMITTKYPFKSFFKKESFVRKSIAVSVTCSSVVCFSLTVIYQHFVQEMPESVCSFLGETFNSTTVFTVTVVFSCLQLGSAVFTVVCYSLIVNAILSSSLQDSETSIKTKRKPPFFVAISVTGSNLICWVPSSVLYLVSLSVKPFPTELLVWNAVLINVINSILNPCIFTLIPWCKNLTKTKSAEKSTVQPPDLSSRHHEN